MKIHLLKPFLSQTALFQKVFACLVFGCCAYFTDTF